MTAKTFAHRRLAHQCQQPVTIWVHRHCADNRCENARCGGRWSDPALSTVNYNTWSTLVRVGELFVVYSLVLLCLYRRVDVCRNGPRGYKILPFGLKTLYHLTLDWQKNDVFHFAAWGLATTAQSCSGRCYRAIVGENVILVCLFLTVLTFCFFFLSVERNNRFFSDQQSDSIVHVGRIRKSTTDHGAS
jgi:hypothetical protein